MEKQTKVLTKIKNSLKHGNEGQLGVKKNDECYTDPQDILNELSQWAALGKFQGKKIICPCDWDVVKPKEGEDPYCTVGGELIDSRDIYSITITYNEPGIEVVGNSVFKAVKSVYVDIWSKEEDTKVEHLALVEDEIEDFLRGKLTCNFVRTFTQNARAWGIQSITASGYNPAIDKGVKFQDVDYSQYDVCVTNPPFSLYGEFMKTIVGNIDFIVLAPLLNRNSTWEGIALYERTAYLGFGIELHMTFENPTKENNYSGTKVVNCDWITSFPEAQAERNAKHFKSGIKYDLYKDEYTVMTGMTMKDGTHPIRVSMSTYPEDFDGWMFTTIGVLDNLDQDTYEWLCLNHHKYFNQTHPELNPFSHKLSTKMFGDKGFCGGILFRKKPEVV